MVLGKTVRSLKKAVFQGVLSQSKEPERTYEQCRHPQQKHRELKVRKLVRCSALFEYQDKQIR